MLPSALRPPTAYGQTLGHVRLLVLGNSSAESARVTEEVISLLSDTDYDDIVHVGQWEDITTAGQGTDDKGVRPKVLKVSTDWVEHPKEHGQEKYEPSRNVELVRMEDFTSEDVRAIRFYLSYHLILNKICLVGFHSGSSTDHNPLTVPRTHTCHPLHFFEFTLALLTIWSKHKHIKPDYPSAYQYPIPYNTFI